MPSIEVTLLVCHELRGWSKSTAPDPNIRHMLVTSPVCHESRAWLNALPPIAWNIALVSVTESVCHELMASLNKLTASLLFVKLLP